MKLNQSGDNPRILHVDFVMKAGKICKEPEVETLMVFKSYWNWPE